MLIVQKLTSVFVTSGPGLIISVLVISTEGALRLPTTYDNHLSESHPSQPMPQSLFNHLNRPWIDLTRQKGSIIKISWPIELNDLKWSVDLRWFFDPVLHSSLDDHVFKTLMIWRWLLKISPQDFLITSCQFFMIWHSLVKAFCKPDNSPYFPFAVCFWLSTKSDLVLKILPIVYFLLEL